MVETEPTETREFFDSTISESVRNLNPLVAKAFRLVDRRDFMPPGQRDLSYIDRAIQVCSGCSVSQPSLVAQMIHLLEPDGKGSVLEIGTGLGYEAALLSHCFKNVYTIDSNPRLTRLAKRKLDQEYKNVYVSTGDGILGLSDQDSFKGIIVTGSARDIPKTLTDQLVKGGRLVIPAGKDPDVQILTVVTNFGEQVETFPLQECWFHPLISNGQGGWTEEALGTARALKRNFIIEELNRDLGGEEARKEFLTKWADISFGLIPENEEDMTFLLDVFSERRRLPDSFYANHGV